MCFIVCLLLIEVHILLVNILELLQILYHLLKKLYALAELVEHNSMNNNRKA